MENQSFVRFPQANHYFNAADRTNQQLPQSNIPLQRIPSPHFGFHISASGQVLPISNTRFFPQTIRAREQAPFQLNQPYSCQTSPDFAFFNRPSYRWSRFDSVQLPVAGPISGANHKSPSYSPVVSQNTMLTIDTEPSPPPSPAATSKPTYNAEAQDDVIPEYVENGQGKYFCVKCKYTTLRADKMQQHLAAHLHGKFVCKDCGRAFIKGCDLHRHYNSMEQGRSRDCRINSSACLMKFKAKKSPPIKFNHESQFISSVEQTTISEVSSFSTNLDSFSSYPNNLPQFSVSSQLFQQPLSRLLYRTPQSNFASHNTTYPNLQIPNFCAEQGSLPLSHSTQPSVNRSINTTVHAPAVVPIMIAPDPNFLEEDEVIVKSEPCSDNYNSQSGIVEKITQSNASQTRFHKSKKRSLESIANSCLNRLTQQVKDIQVSQQSHNADKSSESYPLVTTSQATPTGILSTSSRKRQRKRMLLSSENSLTLSDCEPLKSTPTSIENSHFKNSDPLLAFLDLSGNNGNQVSRNSNLLIDEDLNNVSKCISLNSKVANDMIIKPTNTLLHCNNVRSPLTATDMNLPNSNFTYVEQGVVAMANSPAISFVSSSNNNAKVSVSESSLSNFESSNGSLQMNQEKQTHNKSVKSSELSTSASDISSTSASQVILPVLNVSAETTILTDKLSPVSTSLNKLLSHISPAPPLNSSQCNIALNPDKVISSINALNNSSGISSLSLTCSSTRLSCSTLPSFQKETLKSQELNSISSSMDNNNQLKSNITNSLPPKESSLAVIKSALEIIKDNLGISVPCTKTSFNGVSISHIHKSVTCTNISSSPVENLSQCTNSTHISLGSTLVCPTSALLIDNNKSPANMLATPVTNQINETRRCTQTSGSTCSASNPSVSQMVSSLGSVTNNTGTTISLLDLNSTVSTSNHLKVNSRLSSDTLSTPVKDQVVESSKSPQFSHSLDAVTTSNSQNGLLPTSDLLQVTSSTKTTLQYTNSSPIISDSTSTASQILDSLPISETSITHHQNMNNSNLNRESSVSCDNSDNKNNNQDSSNEIFFRIDDYVDGIVKNSQVFICEDFVEKSSAKISSFKDSNKGSFCTKSSGLISCSMCAFHTKSQYSYKKHKLQHNNNCINHTVSKNNNLTTLSTDPKSSVNEVNPLVICCLCQRSFNNSNDILKHKNLHKAASALSQITPVETAKVSVVTDMFDDSTDALLSVKINKRKHKYFLNENQCKEIRNNKTKNSYRTRKHNKRSSCRRSPRQIKS